MLEQPNQNGQTEKQSLLQENYVLPDQVEEEACIAKIECYRAPIPKLILFGILVLVTGGFLALLAKWKYSVRVLFMYVKTTTMNAQVLLIHCVDGTLDHIRVKDRQFCLDGAIKTYRSFVYRLYTFYCDPNDLKYKPIQFTIKNKTFQQIHEEMGKGITSSEIYDKNMMNYGRNSTDIPPKSNLEILIDEILSPFYIFQLFAIIFWGFFNHYEIYAGFIFGVSLITLTIEFFKVKNNHKKLRQRARYETEVKIFRPFSDIKSINSTFLVPGDLIEIPSNKKIPCDVILLDGTCIMNESMLTGESVPVIKQQLPHNDKIFDAITADQYLLYSGTECLETRQSKQGSPVLGVVLRTGFSTMKGRLVRSFLYSKPEDFKFYRDSLKYIAAMTMIAVACFGFSVKSFVDQGKEVGYIILKSLDIITIAVPPALPTCVAIGASIASSRLEKHKILTKSETKINVAGRVKFMCFDKTGTLTRDSLDLHGVRALAIGKLNRPNFIPLIADNIHKSLNASENTTKALSHKLLELMATCHSLTYVRGTISGDPLDVKMFEATGWRLNQNSTIKGQESGLAFLNPPVYEEPGYYKSLSEVVILKRFDFSPKLQRMSVIVNDPAEQKQRIYVKGSPEMIVTLSKSETIPSDFNQVLLSYTQSGLRAIACATKVLDKNITAGDELDREQYEKELEFLGFLIFENKMKEVTPLIIKKLKEADIHTIMLTGDNPLTAIFVARDCEIIEKNQKVVLGTLETLEDQQQSKKIMWKYIETSENNDTSSINASLSLQADRTFIEKLPMNQQDFEGCKNIETMSEKEIYSTIIRENNLAIAMTGEAFNYLDSLTETSLQLRQALLSKARVLARMRPDDKALIVNKLKNQGYIVGMCGDGANDCPSLKVANVGVSLSEAEASLAAPFMSKVTDISCIDILLREGRTALVTSFQCFKFMSMYSLIQTFSVVILYARVTNFTDLCFLYQDLFIIIPFVFTMSLTGPTDKLSKERPTGSLLSATVLTAMIGQCIIQAAAQYISIIFLEAQEWYKSPTELFDIAVTETGEEEPEVIDYDQTVLFLVGNIQYFATVMAFSIAKPFRKPVYTNYLFFVSLLISTILSMILILIPIPGLMDFLKTKDIDQNFRWILFGIVTINSVITMCYEKFIVSLILAITGKIKQKFKRSRYRVTGQ